MHYPFTLAAPVGSINAHMRTRGASLKAARLEAVALYPSLGMRLQPEQSEEAGRRAASRALLDARSL